MALKNIIFSSILLFGLQSIAMEQPRMGAVQTLKEYRAERDRILEQLDISTPQQVTEGQKDSLLREYGEELFENSKRLYNDSEASIDMTIALTLLSGCTLISSFCVPSLTTYKQAELICAAIGFFCHGCQKHHQAQEYNKAASCVDELIRQKITLSRQHSD